MFERLCPAGQMKLVHCLASAAIGALLLTCAALPSRAIADGKIKVAFVGDSSADGLWGGFTRIVTRDPCLNANFAALRLGKNGTGLTRPDKHDWVADVARIAAKDKPDLYVMSLGLNDRQSVVIGGHVTALDSPEYPNVYGGRVAEMIKNAASSGAGIIWVGLAAMREAPANADALAKNKVFVAAVEAAGSGVQYVDRRKFDVVGGETFNSYGPDKSGAMIQIRAADGVHFTPAGEDIVAAELLPKILGNLRARNVPGATACQK
jgi:hypothetical protein